MEDLPVDAPLTRDQAHAWLARGAFHPAAPGRVGAELEWFVLDSAEPGRIPHPDEVRALLSGTRRPGSSRLTFEPGGQLELSSPPAATPGGAVASLTADLEVVRAALGRAGLGLRGGGVEATRTYRRLVSSPRYDAMAEHFASAGPDCADAGRVMMTATAAVQVNIEAGHDEDAIASRWRRAHTLGPVLAACFAHSPVLAGRPTGDASSRLRAWSVLDPCRTRPVPDGRSGETPRDQWAGYVLDASVLLVRDPAVARDGAFEGRRPDRVFTMGQWVDDPGLAGRPVTGADLDYHCTTLFPPVRPRGFLELRYLDEQDVDTWPVAVLVTAVLHDDDTAGAIADDACRAAEGRWEQAANRGLADPVLAQAALTCFDAAQAALAGAGVPDGLLARVEDYAARYVRAGRCPADDALDLALGARDAARTSVPAPSAAGRSARVRAPA